MRVSEGSRVSNPAAVEDTATPRGAGRLSDRRGDDPPLHGATVAFIVERLREDILTGRAPPGWRLVEWELTSRFGVSRGPVREALRRLAAEGLIEHWPHRGSRRSGKSTPIRRAASRAAPGR